MPLHPSLIIADTHLYIIVYNIMKYEVNQFS